MLKNKYFQVIGGFVAIVFGVLQGIDWLFNKYQIDSFYFNMILIFILISGCVKDYDLNPFTTVMKQIYKAQYDETGVKTLATNKEKDTQNTMDKT